MGEAATAADICAGCGTEILPDDPAVEATTFWGETQRYHEWDDCYRKFRRPRVAADD